MNFELTIEFPWEEAGMTADTLRKLGYNATRTLMEPFAGTYGVMISGDIRQMPEVLDALGIEH